MEQMPGATKWGNMILKTFSMLSVNLFALLSGYLCMGKKWKIVKWVKLWLLVIFYSIAIALTCKVIDGHPFPLKATCLNCIPVCGGYWYFSAYSALFFLMPFINKAINGLEQRQWIYLITALLLCFSVKDCLPYALFRIYTTDDGHTALWLGILYVIGAYFRTYPPAWRKRYLSTLFIFIMILWNVTGEKITLFSGTFPNPFICLLSILFFLILLRVNVRSQLCCRVLKWMSPMAFSVYLIHVGLCRYMDTYLPEVFQHFDYACWLGISVSVLIYLGCTVIDYLRLCLFRLLKTDRLCDKVVSELPSVFRKEVW